GNIVLTRDDEGFKAHRIITLEETGETFETRGDAGLESESDDNGTILGRVTLAENSGGCERLDTRASRFRAAVRQVSVRLHTAAVLRMRRFISLSLFSLTVLALLLVVASPVAAQADLSMTQSASPTVVAPGGTITYTEIVT